MEGIDATDFIETGSLTAKAKADYGGKLVMDDDLAAQVAEQTRILNGGSK